MPELPEIRIMTDYINEMCKGKTFIRVRKSTLTKNDISGIGPVANPELISSFRNSRFKMEARSRGKEISIKLFIKLNISKDDDLETEHYIDINMGTGTWAFVDTGDEPEHSHLMFDTCTGCTLCLVDPSRFAKWKATPYPFQDPTKREDDFFNNFHSTVLGKLLTTNTPPKSHVIRYRNRRGPDPIDEPVVFAYRIYKALGVIDDFKEMPDIKNLLMRRILTVSKNADRHYELVYNGPDSFTITPKDPLFLKQICEVMLDQRYFNGIGNYLRSEILYRADIDPFMPAWKAIVLSCIKSSKKHEDILQLCARVPLEAQEVGGSSMGVWRNPYGYSGDFKKWLQCYGKLYLCYDNKGRKMWMDHKYSPDHKMAQYLKQMRNRNNTLVQHVKNGQVNNNIKMSNKLALQIKNKHSMKSMKSMLP